MEFTFKTSYDTQALTAMAKALRKTTRNKHSKRSHVFGWLLVALVVLLSLPRGEAYVITANRVITWLAALAIVIAFVFEDRLNGSIAKKRMLPGLRSSTVTFTESGYHSATEMGSSDFSYDKITALAETDRYYILIFSKHHAQVYDKLSIMGGTCDDYNAFISRMTNLPVQKV